MKSLSTNKSALISGASIAGPALAFWLKRFGFSVTVVEQSPALNVGGYKIDVRGKAVHVLRAMGLYEKIKACDVAMKTAKFVDEQGNTVSEMAADALGLKMPDDVELLRGDLARVLYEATNNDCEYIFGDSITKMEETDDGVTVNFRHHPSRKFDVVFGADGIHSKVRNLAFGPEEKFSYDLGNYFFAIFSIPPSMAVDREELFYSKDNKMLNIYKTANSDVAKALLVFRKPGLVFDYRDVAQQKKIIEEEFGADAWVVPEILAAMKTSSDFYFDSAKQIHMKDIATNRVGLVGDAAYAPALSSGQGSSMALVGAYVLAHELNRNGDNWDHAFLEYKKTMRNFVDANQALGEFIMTKFMIPSPPTRWQQFVAKLRSFLGIEVDQIEKLRRKSVHAANCVDLTKY